MSGTNQLLLRRLYRSLLKTSKPFTSSPDARVASCLLHRTAVDDDIDWNQHFLHKKERQKAEASDLSKSYAPSLHNSEDDGGDDQENNHSLSAPHRIHFRNLLREVVYGNPSGLVWNNRYTQFPAHIDDPMRMRRILQREFRISAPDHSFDFNTRKQVAFMALRELNKKLTWMDNLENNDSNNDDQEHASPTASYPSSTAVAAKHVSPLPMDDPGSYLKSGTFLVAHPLLTGYFSRSVICILDHSEPDSKSSGGTYGIIVNRKGVVDRMTGEEQTLGDVLRTVPSKLVEAFGEMQVRDGGPVHVALQMVHAQSPDQPTIGGNVLSMIQEEGEDDSSTTTTSSAGSKPTTPSTHASVDVESDRAVYYQGDVLRAAIAIREGDMDRKDFSFYVGASCWQTKQLESEIARGFWIPCKGPPSIAVTGQCEHDNKNIGATNNNSRNQPDDLWLSMMSALGPEEAKLAHLFHGEDQKANADFRGPCDEDI